MDAKLREKARTGELTERDRERAYGPACSDCGDYGCTRTDSQHTFMFPGYTDEAELSFAYNYLEYTYPTYRFLCEAAEFNAELSEQFSSYVDENGPMNRLDFASSWLENYEAELGEELTGIYGEGPPIHFNSYNEENCLSHDIWGIYWTDSTGEHAIIAILEGGDPRVPGNYSWPIVVDCTDEYSILDWSTAGQIWCSDPDCGTSKHYTDYSPPLWNREFIGPHQRIERSYLERSEWSLDGGHSWLHEGSCGTGYIDIAKCPIVELDSLEEDADMEEGTIYVTEEGDGLCPVCLEFKLTC